MGNKTMGIAAKLNKSEPESISENGLSDIVSGKESSESKLALQLRVIEKVF